MVAIAALVGTIGFAAFGLVVPALLCVFVAFPCGTIAKARVTPGSLLAFGIRRIPDGPAAERYRERRCREGAAIREGIERPDDCLATRPRLETAFLVELAAAAVLALVPFVDGNSRLAGRLLIVALIALNGTLPLVSTRRTTRSESLGWGGVRLWMGVKGAGSLSERKAFAILGRRVASFVARGAKRRPRTASSTGSNIVRARRQRAPRELGPVQVTWIAQYARAANGRHFRSSQNGRRRSRGPGWRRREMGADPAPSRRRPRRVPAST